MRCKSDCGVYAVTGICTREAHTRHVGWRVEMESGRILSPSRETAAVQEVYVLLSWTQWYWEIVSKIGVWASGWWVCITYFFHKSCLTNEPEVYYLFKLVFCCHYISVDAEQKYVWLHTGVGLHNVMDTLVTTDAFISISTLVSCYYNTQNVSFKYVEQLVVRHHISYTHW